MRKLFTLLLALLLVVPIVSPAYLQPEDIKFRAGGPQRYNEYFYDPRVQTQKYDVTVHMTPQEAPIFARGYPAYYPRGTARVQTVRSPYKSSSSVHIQTKDLRPSWQDSTFYQGWLYNSKSGATLNMGQFEAINGGVGELIYSGTADLFPYDTVFISREPRPDADPRPSDDIVLNGQIDYGAYQYYAPTPILSKYGQYGRTYIQ
jgi:hypothetical protein